MTTDTRSNVSRIFDMAKGADRKTKEKVVEIINMFGKQGDYQLREWL